MQKREIKYVLGISCQSNIESLQNCEQEYFLNFI